ncbi:MAG: hypothetical protein JW814_12455 [Candidatus Krumholzibacteriota bacterium]|nr:hypothetical protein [Candidatus Krumholzibacteriota bacterium]
MNHKLLVVCAALSFLILSSLNVSAVEMRTETFALDGGGSFMSSPVIWSGNITGGTLFPGTYWIRLDDSNWPDDNPVTTENERWDYIFATYFTYDDTPDNEGWDGDFKGVIGDETPYWRFYTEAGDTLGGLCSSFRVVIRDLNGNAIMEDNEYQNKALSIGFVCYINFSKGCFTSFCGQGNCSGTLDLADESTMQEELYIPSPIYPGGRLYLRDVSCVTDTDASTWGSIKAIYRD